MHTPPPAEVITRKKKEEEGQPQLSIRHKVTTGSLSDRTKLAYTYHINEFLAHYRITDLQPLKEYSPNVLKQMVKDYIVHLRDDRKLSGSSISLHIAAIAHFLYIERDDDYKIDWKKVRLEIPPNENIRRDRAYTIDEIQKMLTVCSRTRERVVIHLLESTGMRVGAIPTIKIRDLSPKSTQQGRVYRIEVYSGSSGSYYCYCNVETAKVIDKHLKDRSDDGEVLKSDSPLFREVYSSLTVKRPRPVSYPHIRYIVSRIVKLSGVKDTFEFTGEVKCARGFRKFYKTQSENSGMKPINVELTHGHSIGMSGHYYRPQENEVLNDYMTHAADALTIDPTQRLKQENQELKSERGQEIARQNHELDRLKIELKENKEQLSEVIKAQEMKSKLEFERFETQVKQYIKGLAGRDIYDIDDVEDDPFS